MKHDRCFSKKCGLVPMRALLFFVPELCAFVEHKGINSRTESISISISNHSGERKALVWRKPDSVSTYVRLPIYDALFSTAPETIFYDLRDDGK